MFIRFIFFVFFIYSINSSAQLYINEIQASNDNTIADNFLEYDDWIEIYNTGNTAIDLAGYYLSDDSTNLIKFQIPATDPLLTTVPVNSYLIFWADNEVAQGANHTNFKLSSSGESVFLTAPDGITIVDSLSFPSITSNQTYKRIPDGSINLIKSNNASPAYTNNNDIGLVEPPIVNLSSGTYTTAQTLVLTATAGTSIYYTVDGSFPNSTSYLYTNPITIDSTVVVKAIASKPGFLDSKIISKTYLINTSHDLPILSISTNNEYLYSDSLGMLVNGTNGTIGDCGGPANYFQEWEYPANVILIDKLGNEGFNVDGGLSVFGNCTRRFAQKSLALKTKSIYPSPNIAYKVFPTQKQDEFRRLRFRNGGNHWKQSMMADLIFHQLIEKTTNADVQSARPVVSYLNGQYHGIYNIRNAYSKHYFRYKFNKYEDSDFDIIRMAKLYTEPYIVDGDSIDFMNLFNSFEGSNVFTPQKIDSIYNTIDIDNFIDYYSSMLWVWTFDWPGTTSPSNQIFWKPKQPEAKWRTTVLDVDLGYLDISHNTYYYLNVPNSLGRNTEKTTRLFRRLNNDVQKFNEELVQRSFTYYNLIFHKDSVAKKIDNYKRLLENEMPQHINQWKDNGGIPSDSIWLAEVEKLKTYAKSRSDTIKKHIAKYHNESTINLTFNFNQNTNGTVALNSNHFKVPFSYVGEYLTNIPLWIHAIPKPGYRFVEWQEINDPTLKYKPTIYAGFNANQTLTPVFEPAKDLVINEIHYNPLGTLEDKEFIELHNPDAKAKPLYGYQFNNGVEFAFPENAVINPNEYIIIAKDANQYAGNGYQVFQWACGSLNNDGEMVFFSSPANEVIDSVRYNDNVNWNQNADGLGYSLALIDDATDNYQPSAWASQASNFETTPGAVNNFCESVVNSPAVANISCNGVNDGFIVTQVTGGTAPFNYSWSNGASTASINNLAPGNYTLTVADFYNCLYTQTFTITEPTALSATLTSTNETYYQNNDGTATVNVSGGISPYSYSWSNGASTASINSLAPGSYSVTVLDTNGCPFSDNTNINPINCNAIAVNVETRNETCLGSNNGLLVIRSISNGTAPYSVLWSTGITGSVANNLTTDTYQLNVADNFGCPFQQNYLIEADNIVQASFTINNVSSANLNDGSISAIASGGDAPYTYNWSNGSNSQNLNNVGLGIYSVTVTDANGCAEFFNQLTIDNSCVASIIQQNSPVINSQIYQVAQFIQSNGKVDVNEMVSFKAGDYIALTDNFEVPIGADFEAKIEGCQ